MPKAQVEAKIEVITVRKIFEPRSDRGPYGVKDEHGNVWKVWSDKMVDLNLLEGGTYAVMYTPGEYKGRVDNTIISANPHGDAKPTTSTAQPQASTDRSEDIAVQGISHCPEIAAAAAEGDVAKGVKILRSLRLIWREYKKQSVIAPTGGAEFDDDIPY